MSLSLDSLGRFFFQFLSKEDYFDPDLPPPPSSCTDKYDCVLDQQCEYLGKTYTDNPRYAYLIEVMRLVCCCFSYISGYVIMSDKRLQNHPGKLIALICLFQGGYM